MTEQKTVRIIRSMDHAYYIIRISTRGSLAEQIIRLRNENEVEHIS